MKVIPCWKLVLAFAALSLPGADLTRAQAPLEPAQMPANTVFYFIWRGQPGAELRKTNSIAALWDDPGFSPVRSAFAKALLKNSQEKRTPGSAEAEGKSEPRTTSAELNEYATLLENPFVIGYLSDPQKRVAGSAGARTNRSGGTAESGEPDNSWHGMFLVYDRSGKEALLTKAVVGLRASEKEVPQISQVTIANVPVLKVQRKGSVTFWAENGKYAVSSNETAVMQEILGRLNDSGKSGSLAESPAYKEAQPLLGSGPVEFFLRVPNLKEFAADSKAGMFSVGPILDAARLDTVHSLTGRMTLEGARTRLQITIFGDTGHGSLFDIWDQGAAAPAALELMPADAISFSDTQINLSGLYETVQRITHAVLPAGPGNPDMFENMGQAKLGQSISSALALFTGEFASLQTSPSLDATRQAYLVGIRNKPDTLKLLRTTMSDRITSERSEGDNKFLKISAEGGQQAAGTAQWNFYHVAVTPHFLVISSRLETVRELLARSPGPSGARLSASADFKTARAQFPAQLNGLGYFDLRKLDWRAMKERMIEESKKSSGTPRAAHGAAKAGAAMETPEWIKEMNPDVFARHLHVASSASWKDAQGLHFDQWIE